MILLIQNVFVVVWYLTTWLRIAMCNPDSEPNCPVDVIENANAELQLSCMDELESPLSLLEQVLSQGYVTNQKIFNNSEMIGIKNTFDVVEELLGGYIGQEVNIHLFFKEIWDIATHPNVINLLNQLMPNGYAIIATGTAIKYPKTSNYVGLHQDYKYWQLKDDHSNSKQELSIVTLFLAIDNITYETGCVQYYPYSHNISNPDGYKYIKNTSSSENILFDGQEIVSQLETNKSVNITLEPGFASAHHSRLLHSSGPNFSENKRRLAFVWNVINLNVELIGEVYDNEAVRGYRRPYIVNMGKEKEEEEERKLLFPYQYVSAPNFTRQTCSDQGYTDDEFEKCRDDFLQFYSIFDFDSITETSRGKTRQHFDFKPMEQE